MQHLLLAVAPWQHSCRCAVTMTAIIKQHCCNSAGCQLSQPGLQVVEEAPHSLEIVLKLKRQRAGQSYKMEFLHLQALEQTLRKIKAYKRPQPWENPEVLHCFERHVSAGSKETFSLEDFKRRAAHNDRSVGALANRMGLCTAWQQLFAWGRMNLTGCPKRWVCILSLRLAAECWAGAHACQSSCSSAALEIFGRRAARVDRSDGVLHHEWASNRTTTAMICLGEPITRWQ